MTPGAEIEPGPHWWKASALTTRPTLPPNKALMKAVDDWMTAGNRWEPYLTFRC